MAHCDGCGAGYNLAVSGCDATDHGHFGYVPDLERSGEAMTSNGETWFKIGNGDWTKGEPPAWLRDDDSW